MSDKKTILEVDVLAKTENIRELTTEELAELDLIKEESDSLNAEREAKIAARTSALAKLAALGLTEEEIAAL